MSNDGYVKQLSAGKFENHDDFHYITASVKPRTNDKDPVTKQPFYKTWIIVSSKNIAKVIFSAFCTCKGG